jgi:preprotein translocase subunit SecE
MGRQVAVVLYVVAMAAVIVGVDLVFFRNAASPHSPCRGG